MYKKVSTDMNFVEREKQVEKFWEDNQIFEKSMKVREGNPSYVFYDGPPTANGKPHIGHVETRVIKDMIPRYRTMKGYQVPRKAGWDTHGLPVELEVEKKLGLDGKDQIEKYGVEPFIEQCKESVWKYEGMWEDFSHTVGFWADMKNPYVTYHNDYIESEWWALKEIWKKGLLYEGHKIVPYCPRCGTPLSSHEVAQGYKDVKERSAVVRFKVKGEDAYILAWTTTPWTLPSNVALCVNPDEDYVKVTSKGYTYYMAAALVDTVLGEGAEILEHYQGKDLEFKEYEPLFPYAEKRIGNFEALTRWWLDNPNPLTYQQALGMSDDLYRHFLSHPLISEDEALRLARKGLVTESEYNDLQLWYFNGHTMSCWFGPLGVDGTGSLYGLTFDYQTASPTKTQFYLLDDYYRVMNHLTE